MIETQVNLVETDESILSIIEILKSSFESHQLEDMIEHHIFLTKLVKYLKQNPSEEHEVYVKKLDYFNKYITATNSVYQLKGKDKLQSLYEELIEIDIIDFLHICYRRIEYTTKNNYEKWLDTNAALIQKLSLQKENNTYERATVDEFAKKFRKLFPKKLDAVCIKDKFNRYVFSPVLFINGKYVSLKHPITNKQWSLSGYIEEASSVSVKINKLKVGDIIEVGYEAVRALDKEYTHAFISLKYTNFKVLGQSLETILSDKFTNEEILGIYKNLSVYPPDSQRLIEKFIPLLLPQATDLESKIQEKRKVNQQLKETLEKIEHEKAEFETKKLKVKSVLNKEEKIWCNILEELAYVDTDNEKISDAIPYNKETFIKDLQARIYYQSGKELIYDQAILKLVMNAIRANILTILTGPSGTGKSSLIEAIGDAMTNVKVTMIPVQSNWTDAQDLLGYFHPNEKVFMATPFMEALSKARLAEMQNKDELHIICLDEMNLAHIEYYFAQFLSVREQKSQTISLYPAYYQQWALAVKENEIEADAYMKKNASMLVENYPAVFKIPSNVRFVGTLNMDHTVKALSPKVVDRSLIIELLKLTTDQKHRMVEEIEKHQDNATITLNKEVFMKEKYELNENMLNEILKVSNKFEAFRDIPLNSRGEKHLREILSYIENVTSQDIDLLIKGKVLPRIELKKDLIDENILRSELQLYPHSLKKWVSMLQTDYTVSFW